MEPAIEEAKSAALRVLLNNASGPFDGLPRTAGWGYPEPYTRDLLISALGILASGREDLLQVLRRVMKLLSQHQSPRGQIPSMVHDPENRGASDTTPLFLMVLGLFRKQSGETRFLEGAAAKALQWMAYQTIDDRILVGQQPTSDWRDEQWVLGHGLYVNALVHGYLRGLGLDDQAAALRAAVNRADGEGFAIQGQPVYALWFYKVLRNKRCDLLGNSLAILTGLADGDRARAMVAWIEAQCADLRIRGELALDLPPCLFPFVQPSDPDWRPRCGIYNLPGDYHNGGVWPFVCGFYIAALVAAGELHLAEKKLLALTALVRQARDLPPTHAGAFGFNEWFRAQDGRPAGQDWQSWSAAMYLYAAACVEAGKVLFFDGV
ncbi:MAG: amylo-alpha-1,6-glucosidase [Acidobacteria bacterium]|nr:amylo-alpha-1,6-glucosidase [Acidobacteriota bacterium]MBI3487192.1 amylo-alpha-1,6-glucosidase [Acidobacteriota bacterium]